MLLVWLCRFKDNFTQHLMGTWNGVVEGVVPAKVPVI